MSRGLGASWGNETMPLEFVIFFLGAIPLYVAYRLKLLNFEQYAYFMVGIIFLGLLIPSLMTPRDVFQSLIQIAVPVIMMFLIVHEGLKYKKKREQKRRD